MHHTLYAAARRWWDRLARKESEPSASIPHRIAHAYWQGCSNTFIANTQYYEKCERALRERILPQLGQPARLLDIGCGNGRYTLVLAETAGRVDAWDLSPLLIADARRAALKNGVRHVHFRVGDATRLAPACRYDVVSCMGVLSTVIDDWAFEKVVNALCGSLKPGGRLLLRDSLSTLPDGQLVHMTDYATIYRYEPPYREAFRSRGMTLEEEILLAEFGTSVNRYFIFRATGGTGRT